MKYIFIINPLSGKTDYQLVKNNIMKVMANKDYKIIETKRPKDATIIASKYKNDDSVIIYSVGGDGTLNEVINGIAGGKCKLGIIPTGSGNDFYKSVKAYNKKESTIDLGQLNGIYFINIASVGFDADVCNQANLIKESGKYKKMAYYLGAIKTLFNFKYKEYKLEIDNKKYQGMYTIIAICNGRYYGGGFQIAPLASFDDDYFDVYLANKMSRLRLIHLLIKLIRAKHEKSPYIKKIKAKNITIKANKEMTVNIDGEIIQTKFLNIKMVPNAITIYNDKKVVQSILESL